MNKINYRICAPIPGREQIALLLGASAPLPIKFKVVRVEKQKPSSPSTTRPKIIEQVQTLSVFVKNFEDDRRSKTIKLLGHTGEKNEQPVVVDLCYTRGISSFVRVERTEVPDRSAATSELLLSGDSSCWQEINPPAAKAQELELLEAEVIEPAPTLSLGSSQSNSIIQLERSNRPSGFAACFQGIAWKLRRLLGRQKNQLQIGPGQRGEVLLLNDTNNASVVPEPFTVVPLPLTAKPKRKAVRRLLKAGIRKIVGKKKPLKRVRVGVLKKAPYVRRPRKAA